MTRRISYTHADDIYSTYMYLWHCFRVLKRLRDPVACEQPFWVRGGELSPHSPCSCAGDLELKAEGVGWGAVRFEIYDIRKETLNVIKRSKIESWGNGDGNKDGKKAIGLDCQNNNFARASRFFCTFLCRRCTTSTWNCLISRFLEALTQDNDPLFLFLNFNTVL